MAVVLLPAAVLARPCLVGTPTEHDADAAEIRATLDAIDAACPCASYAPRERGRYRSCTRTVVDDRVASLALRDGCAGTARRIGRTAVCGSSFADAAPCVKRRGARLTCKITAASRCSPPFGVDTTRSPCPAFTRCLEAADTNGDLLIALPGDSGICAGPHCGNGVVEGTEECDDGNPIAWDGCSPTCEVEPDCNPDGTYVLSTAITYVCSTTGEGPFQKTVTRIVLADHGRDVDVLETPGGIAGPPLNCFGSPVNRTDAEFTLFECFLVARLNASFTDPNTLSGNLTMSMETPSGLACTPNPFFDCPPGTFSISAVR